MPTDAHRTLMLLPWLELGGADTFNLDLARQLVRRHGHRLTIVTTLPGEHTWRARFAELSDDIVPLTPDIPPAEQPAALRDIIASRRIETLFLSHSEFGYALLPFLRAACPGLAVLDFLHIEEETQGGGYPRHALDRAPWLDLTVVSSEHLRRWMLARGGNPERIAVCTTNIDTALWDSKRFDRRAIRAGLDAQEPVVLYAARLAPQKQPRLVAEIARSLQRAGSRFTMLVAGDGPEREWLEAFVRRERLASVRLLGALDADRVREVMAAADLFFLPSQHEGISLALYEAMAMGLACVVADVGGQRELVTPGCGVLVAPGANEREAYRAALTDLLADPAARHAMGAAARRRVVEHFPLERMGTRMAALLAHATLLARHEPREATEHDAARAVERAVRHAEEYVLAHRLWNDVDTRGGVAVAAVRRVKQALRPAFRWALARDERIGRVAVSARNVLARLLVRGKA